MKKKEDTAPCEQLEDHFEERMKWNESHNRIEWNARYISCWGVWIKNESCTGAPAFDEVMLVKKMSKIFKVVFLPADDDPTETTRTSKQRVLDRHTILLAWLMCH
jgi:hypothetical protein